jgi:hypothetical protein
VAKALPYLTHPRSSPLAPTHPPTHPPTQQVIRLCERHRLHTAALYVLTRIGDARKPLVDLLGAAAAAAAGGDAAAARAVALKLLVWITGAFRGVAYPPNSGLIAA